MHHHFQSKFLIEFLNSQGFCCSYDEVKRYARCASMTEHEIPKNYGPQNFLQYATDNVDHNIRTLDGKNTFTECASLHLSHQGSTSKQGSDEQM